GGVEGDVGDSGGMEKVEGQEASASPPSVGHAKLLTHLALGWLSLEGRFLSTSREDPYEDFALEEAIFRGLERVSARVWRNSLSVIIGRAQLARLETDLAYCTKKGIPVVRRFTAGGAVHNGRGNTNWAIFMPAA